MKHDDLIQKLETLETPDIELPGHRQTLRMALLNSGRFRKRTTADWARILAPVTAALVLIVVVGFFNVIQPRLQIVQAKDIARDDPHVQALLEEYGLEIAEVKLQGDQAFVLLAPQCARLLAGDSNQAGDPISGWSGEPVPAPEEGSSVPEEGLFAGYVLRVDLLEKKVSGFGQLHEVTGLGDIDLEEIDFASLEPPEVAAPEEAGVD